MRRFSFTACFVVLVFLWSGISADGVRQEFSKSVTRLTFDPAVDYYPSWSPDGKRIVFSSHRAGGNLWIVPLDGGPATQLTETNANHPSWSPDGSYIAFDSDQGSVVRLVSADGGVPVRIVPDSIAISRGAHPCWSNDGSKVTFTAEGDIWTVDLSSGELTRIFHRDGFRARAFSWSPDNNYLAADVGAVDKNDDDIWLIPADSGEPIVLTNLPGREGNPKFSPDGSMIVFMADIAGKKELRIMSTDGRKWIRITGHDGFNANPRWSPDGTKIAFASDMNGKPDIYVMELDIAKVREALKAED